MDTGLTLLLAGAISALVAISIVGVASLATYIDGHIKDAGLVLMGLAIIALINGALVRRVAFGVVLAGALYLLALNWGRIANVF